MVRFTKYHVGLLSRATITIGSGSNFRLTLQVKEDDAISHDMLVIKKALEEYRITLKDVQSERVINGHLYKYHNYRIDKRNDLCKFIKLCRQKVETNGCALIRKWRSMKNKHPEIYESKYQAYFDEQMEQVH